MQEKYTSKMVKRTITITEEQEKFIEEETIDLSLFIQKKLNERIAERENLKEEIERRRGRL